MSKTKIVRLRPVFGAGYKGAMQTGHGTLREITVSEKAYEALRKGAATCELVGYERPKRFSSVVDEDVFGEKLILKGEPVEVGPGVKIVSRSEIEVETS